MKIARFLHEGAERYGIVEGTSVRLATGTPFDFLQATGTTLPLADLQLLPPTRPESGLHSPLSGSRLEFGSPFPSSRLFQQALDRVIAPLTT